MGKVPQISSQDLLRILGTFPQHMLQDDSNRAFCLSSAVINQYFDREWVDQHVSPETPKPGFLRVVAGHDRETQRSTFRIVDFAELLLNLAHIDGVDRCLEDLRRGNIESTCAELDFGRIEATDFSEKTVENTLHDARDQFPKDQPSAGALLPSRPPCRRQDGKAAPRQSTHSISDRIAGLVRLEVPATRARGRHEPLTTPVPRTGAGGVKEGDT